VKEISIIACLFKFLRARESKAWPRFASQGLSRKERGARRVQAALHTGAVPKKRSASGRCDCAHGRRNCLEENKEGGGKRV